MSKIKKREYVKITQSRVTQIISINFQSSLITAYVQPKKYPKRLCLTSKILQNDYGQKSKQMRSHQEVMSSWETDVGYSRYYQARKLCLRCKQFCKRCALVQKNDDDVIRVIFHQSCVSIAAKQNELVHDQGLLSIKHASVKVRVHLTICEIHVARTYVDRNMHPRMARQPK